MQLTVGGNSISLSNEWKDILIGTHQFVPLTHNGEHQERPAHWTLTKENQ